MKPLRLAIIGVGHLGRIHARIAGTVPGIELVGVADPVQPNREAVAAECGVPAVADYRELAGRIDAAVIAAPTRLHHAVGMDLLEAGVHLLIEKPLASNVAQADDLVRAARRNSLVLQVGHVERFNPALSAVLPHLREARYIEASRLGAFTGRSTDIGVVLDLMIHDIDLVLWLVRSPLVHVDALGIAVLGEHEDAANARLVFENGCVATLNASRISYQPARQMHVWTPTGFASIDFGSRKVSLVRPAQDVLQRRFNADALPPSERLKIKDELFVSHLVKEDLQAEPVDAITAEQTDFAESIRAGRAPRVSGEQARDALAVAEEVLARIAAHRWDGHVAGRIGPHALPAPSTIPAPHFLTQPAAALQREAG
jgi:predicted dehydrogenase